MRFFYKHTSFVLLLYFLLVFTLTMYLYSYITQDVPSETSSSFLIWYPLNLAYIYIYMFLFIILVKCLFVLTRTYLAFKHIDSLIYSSFKKFNLSRDYNNLLYNNYILISIFFSFTFCLFNLIVKGTFIILQQTNLPLITHSFVHNDL